MTMPNGSVDKNGNILFCPTCGECYPYHHSSVKHNWKSAAMKKYYKRGDANFIPHVCLISKNITEETLKEYLPDNTKIINDNIVLNNIEDWKTQVDKCNAICIVDGDVQRGEDMISISPLWLIEVMYGGGSIILVSDGVLYQIENGTIHSVSKWNV